MNCLQLSILCLCVVFISAELLGPESRKKSDNNDEEEEVVERLDSKSNTVDADYLKELTEAMNKEIVTLQEYADALRSSKDVMPKDDENKGTVDVIML